jgi:phosphoacetylglucosamine mutase
MKADLLDSIVFTVGLLAALRSHTDHGEASGVMVTASHNPIQDNGVKIVDKHGEMLPMEWEKYAIKLANCATGQDLYNEFKKIAHETNNDTILSENSNPIVVIIGHDSRPSSEALVQSIIDAVQVFSKAKVINYGLLTTPQLHWMVWRGNEEHKQKTEEDYYRHVSESFQSLLDPLGKKNIKVGKVFVDCANGIGGPTLEKLSKYISAMDLVLLNKSDLNDLNNNCGAEFVQKARKYPTNFDKSDGTVVSIDGDADRVVISYKKDDQSFGLLDGDKIATLFAKFIAELFSKVNLSSHLRLGIVQTAYANGASTKYLKSVLNPSNVACVATGVKHLHHKAKDFDVGIYFEANGHGTVTFTDKALKSINDAVQNSTDREAAVRLKSFVDLINPVVGDAICDFLAVEALLHYYGWNANAWDKYLYNDLPSVQSKLKVKDRRIVKTTADETQVTAPNGVQNKLNHLMSKYKSGRAFIRPSGTEDVIRVYAEAETDHEAKSLAIDVLNLIYYDLQGIEEPPKL